jgi:O-antigen ligase
MPDYTEAGVSSQRLAARPLLPRDFAPAALAGAAVLTAGIIGVALAVRLPVGIGLLAALLYGVIAVHRLDVGLALFVPLVFFEALPALNIAGKAAGLFVAAAWLGALLRGRVDAAGVIRRHRRMFEALALLLVWLSLSIAWAEDPGKAVGDLWHWFAVALVFLVVATVMATPRVLELVVGAFVAGTVLSVVVGFATGRVDFGDTAQSTAQTTGRLAGGIGDPNFLAAGVVASLVFAVGLMVVTRNLALRWALITSVGVLAIGLAATNSRGGFVAVLVALLAGLAFLKRGRVYIVVLALVLLGAFTAWVTVNPSALKRLTAPDSGGSGREDLWTVAWRATADHPIVGVGLNNFSTVSPDYTRRPGTLRRVRRVSEIHEAVHNTYLELLVSAGAVGLALFLFFVFACLRATWLACRAFEARGDPGLAALGQSILVGMIGILAASFFISAGVDKRLWIAFALGPALLTVASRAESRSEEAYPAS